MPVCNQHLPPNAHVMPAWCSSECHLTGPLAGRETEWGTGRGRHAGWGGALCGWVQGADLPAAALALGNLTHNGEVDSSLAQEINTHRRVLALPRQ